MQPVRSTTSAADLTLELRGLKLEINELKGQKERAVKAVAEAVASVADLNTRAQDLRGQITQSQTQVENTTKYAQAVLQTCIKVTREAVDSAVAAVDFVKGMNGQIAAAKLELTDIQKAGEQTMEAVRLEEVRISQANSDLIIHQGRLKKHFEDAGVPLTL